MATRTIYSCDWCGTDSPTIGSVGEGWERHILRDRQGAVWLCGTCDGEFWKHIDAAKMFCKSRLACQFAPLAEEKP